MRPYLWDGLYGGSLLFQALSRFVMFVYAADVLGMDEYSHWPIIIAFAGYSVVMGRGLLPYLAIQLPILHGRENTEQLFSAFIFARRKVAVDWGLALLIALSFLFGKEYKFISLGILIAIAWSVCQLHVKLFRSLEKIHTLFLSTVLGAFVFLVAGLLIIKTSIYELFFCYFLSLLVQAVFLFWQAQKLAGLREQISKPAGPGFYADAKLDYMASVFLFAVLGTFDRWLAEFFLMDTSGSYSVVVFSMMIGFLFLTISSQIIEPKIYRASSSVSRKTSMSAYGAVLCVLFVAIFLLIYLALFQFKIPFTGNIRAVRIEFITGFSLFLVLMPGVVFSAALKSVKMISIVNLSSLLAILVGLSCFLILELYGIGAGEIASIQASLFFCYLFYSVANYLSYRRWVK